MDNVVCNGGIGLSVPERLCEGSEVPGHIAIQLLVGGGIIGSGEPRSDKQKGNTQYDEEDGEYGSDLPEKQVAAYGLY